MLISNSKFNELNVDDVTNYINSLLRMTAVGIMTDKEAYDLSVLALGKYMGIPDISSVSISDLRKSVELPDYNYSVGDRPNCRCSTSRLLVPLIEEVARMVHFSHHYVAQDGVDGAIRSFSEMPTRNRPRGVWRLDNKEADSKVIFPSAMRDALGPWAHSLHEVVVVNTAPRSIKLILVPHEQQIDSPV